MLLLTWFRPAPACNNARPKDGSQHCRRFSRQSQQESRAIRLLSGMEAQTGRGQNEVTKSNVISRVTVCFPGTSPTAFVTAFPHPCCKLSGFEMFTYHWLPVGRSGTYQATTDPFKERFDA